MRKSTIDMRENVLYAEDLLAAGTPMVVFDVETTGLNKNTDRILSFSAIKVVLKDGIHQIDEKLDLFINPGFPIPEKVTEINGITNERVKNEKKEEEAIYTIHKFLGEKPFVAGYNSISFDEKFMDAMYLRTLGIPFEPLFHIDVMKMGKEKLALQNYKLCTLAHELGADVGLTFHQSMDDVIATFRCFDLLRLEYTNPEPKQETIKIKVGDARYWEGPRWNLRRIYISAFPPFNRTKIYYDIIRKEWVADDNTIDLQDIRDNILQKYGVSDETELISAVK